MAKKKGKQVPGPVKTTASNPVPAQKQQVVNKKPVAAANKDGFFSKYAEQLIVAGIALFTYLFLQSSLQNKLTNWDDNGYLNDDRYIKDLTSEGIKNIFATDKPIMGNYHPLTILSYAIEYSYKGLEPWIYHFDSLILHILVTIAVYIFVKLLTRRVAAAAVAALLFGIHPMHVESVAWAAGRKDVLYGLFYMLSCISYIYYLRAAGSKKIGWYISMLALFVCSLLSKPVAVTLPVALFAIDYFEKRKFDYWLFLDKLPGLILSVIFGLLSIKEQRVFGAYDNLDISFTHIERLALGSYAFCTYLWKAVLPLPADLCCYYPYPAPVNGALPGHFYLYLLATVALFVSLLLFVRKNKVVIFGSAFFMINIFLLLQFVPVGSAIIADRYSYLPYLGLFFIAGWYVSEYFEKKEKQSQRYLVLSIVLIYCVVLGFISNNRCKDWYDSVTLWRDEIEKHHESPNPYNNLAAIYNDRIPGSKTPQERKNNYDSTMYCLEQAIAIKPDFINSIICLGILQRTNGDIDSAKVTLYKANRIDAKNAEVYLELGVVFSIKHQYDSAAYAFRTALKIKPFFPECHSNYANFLDITGNIDSSLIEYDIAIKQNPDAYIPYLNRARIYTRQGKFENAMKDFTMAVEKSPEMAEIYYSRSQCYNKMGNKLLALQDADKAISLGYNQVDQTYYQSLKK